jgi:hypothetical protein
MKYGWIGTLIGVFLFTLSSGYAVATANAAYIREGTSHGIKYMAGGVGINERTAMDRMDKGYNLKVVFAEPSGPYLANVNVEILNASGKKLVETTDNGPWFFAKLPDGKYRVVATFNGKKEAREVEIGKTLQTVTETKPMKAQAAKVESSKNVRSATEAQPAKREAKRAETRKGLQTVTFYWKA